MTTIPTSNNDFAEALKVIGSIFGEALAEIAAQEQKTAHAAPVATAKPDSENPDIVTISMTRADYEKDAALLRRASQLQAALDKAHKNLAAERNRSASYSATIAADKKTIMRMQGEIDNLKMAAPHTVPVIIIDSVAYDEDQIRQLLAAKASAADYRQAMIDTEGRWRRYAENLEVTKRALDTRVIALEAEVKQERNLRQRYQGEAAKLGREVSILKHNAASRGDDEVNKLRKNLAAEKNRNHSYETTIGELRFKVRDLENKVAAAAPAAVEADHYSAIIDGAPYTKAELETIVRTSAKRAEIIESLTKQRDEALARAKGYAEQVHTYSYQGRDLTPDEIGKYLDLGIAAENAKLTVGAINALNTEPAKASYPGPQTIEVEHPDQDFVRLKYPDRTLDIAASLIPQMVDDIGLLKTRINNYEAREKRITERNKQQASSLQAAEAEMEKLRQQIDELSKGRAEDSKVIRQLTIERNLLQGRLNSRGEKPNVVNGQILEAGQSYMTTALGMLPIDSNGMRQLSDALDTYRARVQALTNGLREWIKE